MTDTYPPHTTVARSIDPDLLTRTSWIDAYTAYVQIARVCIYEVSIHTVHYTHGPKIISHTALFLSFCYAPKRPSPLFLYIPQKKPSFNDNVVLRSRSIIY